MAKKLTARKKQWIERTVQNDRRYKAIVYNRAFVCLFFVLLQLGVTVTLLFITDFGWLVQLFVGVFSALTVLYLAGREQRRPTRTLWIILLLAAPIVGVPLYVLYGDGKQGRRMTKKYRRAQKKLAEYSFLPALPTKRGMDSVFQTLGCQTYTDGEVTYYPTGKQLFEGMKNSLRNAKQFILMEYFILSGGKMWGELLKLLLEKAEEGVQVKLIYDDFGSMFSLPPKYGRYLESLHPNIRCFAFNKVYPIFSSRYNHRDHRKILVVDGKVAFTGGANIADEYIDEKKRFGYWKDSGVRITGSGVAALAKTFLETWIAFKEPKLNPEPYLQAKSAPQQGEKIVPYADTPLDEAQVAETVYLEMIEMAKERVYITTPYLVLDELLRTSLCMAAARGVDVRIVTPSIPDKKTVFRLTRANYDALLKAGVRIYEYTPGFMHAKQTLADDCAAVGTANYDYRSLYLHFENMVYFEGNAVAALEEDFINVFTVSRERTVENASRGRFARMFDALLRLFEPLL